MHRTLPILLGLALAAAFPGISQANQACSNAAAQAERSERLPPRLMQAISLAESGRWDDDRRANIAWPWTINVGGQGRYFDTKEQAVAEVERLRARGVRSIDVGCM